MPEKQNGDTFAAKAAANARFFHAAERAELHGRRNYAAYLRKTFRGSTPYQWYRRALSVFSPTFFLFRLFRILLRVIRFVETSAYLLLALTVCVLLLPAALLSFLSFSYAAAGERRRANRVLRACFVEQTVLLFGAAEGDAARYAAFAPGATVVLISDARFSPDPRKATLAFFWEPNGVLVVREAYYFYLRRTLLPLSRRAIEIF